MFLVVVYEECVDPYIKDLYLTSLHFGWRCVFRFPRRSGRAVTIVTQYDVELFQKIEHLTGHKMEEFPSEEEGVLLLLERVNEAQRMATMAMKEKDAEAKGGQRGRGKRGADDDDDHGPVFKKKRY